MSKTYSADRIWREELKKTPDLYVGQVLEKLNRHPNKKSKKASQHKRYLSTSNPTYCWRNPIGEEHDKSSRARLIRKAGVGILRARLKNEANRIIEETINDSTI